MEFSQLEAEWHPTLNLPLVFNSSLKTGSKYWWLGKCGHEWDALLGNRQKGQRCPVCSGRRVLAGFNDLATTHPDVASEWHPTKNGDLIPQHFGKGSDKKVWWLGKCGHEWDTVIGERTQGRGCPICRGLRIIKGINDLATTHPDIASEWHPTKNGKNTPEQVVSGSSRKVWWLGKCGHEWNAVLNSRARNGNGCPVCSGLRVLIGFNDLATTHPVTASQWHPTRNELTTEQVIAGSNKKFWWQCTEGHEWEAVLASRALGNNGCPVCSGRKVLMGFNDLATINPVLAGEWHPTKNGHLTPKEITVGSAKKIWWQADCGHEWRNSINNRSGRGDGCPICSGNKILGGFNDLATTHPALAAEWHPSKNKDLTAQQVASGSEKRVWWLGRCGHEWEAWIGNRAGHNQNCPVCANQMILVGFNDLATTHPDVASEWHPTKNGNLTPQQVVAGSNNKIWWIGACDHEWDTSISKRSRRDFGCTICSGYRVLIGFNDLATINPKLAGEWHPTKNGNLTPQQVTAGKSKKVWWLGNCGHEWEAQIASRSRGGHGCSRCVKQVSKPEELIREYLTGLGLMVEGSNWTVLKHKRSQLDLWLPEKNIAIEFNGIHWHKEKYRGKDSHYNKWLDCKNKGVQLIQIWEDDWSLHPEIILRMLASKLGASKTGSVRRDTKILAITEKQATKFLNENHLHGFASGSSYLGIVESGNTENLQAVMALEETISNEKSLEIIRYASISNPSYNFSQLLAYAVREYNLESITVIADNCEADEKFYESNGFIADKELPPDYMYVTRTERKPKSEYPMERFRDDPNLRWEEGLTEMELADLNGLNRIWDAGKTCFRLI